jgi:hypothetical protein
MAIEELLRVVSPPDQPLEKGDAEAWTKVQQTLGTPLPSDYRDFGIHYGTGYFDDPGRLIIDVWNPFSPGYHEQLAGVCDSLRLELGLRSDTNVPYGVFPDQPGWLPWGHDMDGNFLCWLTEGEPEAWPIILLTPVRDSFQQLKLSLTTFLAGAFSRQLQLMFWQEPAFFAGPELVRFVSRRSSPA